jgi:hypothetical protein
MSTSTMHCALDCGANAKQIVHDWRKITDNKVPFSEKLQSLHNTCWFNVVIKALAILKIMLSNCQARALLGVLYDANGSIGSPCDITRCLKDIRVNFYETSPTKKEPNLLRSQYIQGAPNVLFLNTHFHYNLVMKTKDVESMQISHMFVKRDLVWNIPHTNMVQEQKHEKRQQDRIQQKKCQQDRIQQDRIQQKKRQQEQILQDAKFAENLAKDLDTLDIQCFNDSVLARAFAGK